VKFSRDLPAGSPYAAREALAGKDVAGGVQRRLRGSPMRRTKLRGLKRNAAVVLGNVGTVEDVPVLQQALNDEEPLVREHAAWALARVRTRSSP
jgi:epoxyqueuosine reductase